MNFNKIMVSCCYFIVVLALLLAGKQNPNLPAKHFISPAKQHVVYFRKIEYVKNSDPGSVYNASYIKYAINIVSKEGKDTVKVNYCNVYQAEQGEKQPSLSDIFNGIEWSPKEHFLILPEEKWPAYLSSPKRKAVALDPQLSWDISTFKIDSLIWADSMQIIGDAWGDCNYGVTLFNGRTGKKKWPAHSKSPVGYKIKSIENNAVIVESFPDNCATQEEVDNFIKKSFIINFSSLSVDIYEQ